MPPPPQLPSCPKHSVRNLRRFLVTVAVYLTRSRDRSITRKSRGESDDSQQGQLDGTDTLQPVDLEWIIFGVIWAFLLMNVTVYLSWSQE